VKSDRSVDDLILNPNDEKAAGWGLCDDSVNDALLLEFARLLVPEPYVEFVIICHKGLLARLDANRYRWDLRDILQQYK
jgi:hypothetical protein